MVDIAEDVPHLSAETFAALQEFYKEQELRELQQNNVDVDNDCNLTFAEDWQLSQFWYDKNTITTLTNIALKAAGNNAKIALVSCPSLYKSLKGQLGTEGEVNIYEYDERFSKFGSDFKHYDYNNPLELPSDKSKYYDIVIADPPFLSPECLEKVVTTIMYLATDKIMLCTGKVMSELVSKLLNLKEIPFKPQHENNLANEFSCFTNFPVEASIKND